MSFFLWLLCLSLGSRCGSSSSNTRLLIFRLLNIFGVLLTGGEVSVGVTTHMLADTTFVSSFKQSETSHLLESFFLLVHYNVDVLLGETI